MSFVKRGNMNLEENYLTFAELMERQRLQALDEQWRTLLRDPIGRDMANIMRKMKAIPPSKQEQKAILRRLHGSQNGIPLEIVSIVCPDYATQSVGGVAKYTFDGLGDGIGLVAERALEVHLRMHEFSQKKGLLFNFVIAIADQEADDNTTLRRVNLTKDEFVSQMRKSQESLRVAALVRGVNIRTPFLTEIAPDKWIISREEAKATMKALPENHHKDVVRKRWKLYEKWEGRPLSDAEALDRAIGDVEGYIAVGKYLSAENRLILGLDSPIMATSMRHGTDGTPVAYFERDSYC